MRAAPIVPVWTVSVRSGECRVSGSGSGLDQADPGVPVGQGGTGTATAAERCGRVLVQRARLADGLAGDPDVGSVDRGGAVVTPPGPDRVVEGPVPGEPV